jgi:hypothetical protein
VLWLSLACIVSATFLFYFIYFIEVVECGWVRKSCSSQIFGCNFIFRGRALGAWCVISLQGSILLMFHLGNQLMDVNDIWYGMSTLKFVGLILLRILQYEYFTFESGLLNMDYIYIHPRSYVVCGSEKGYISLYDVSQDRFSHKRNVKVGRMVPENLL